MHIAVTHFLVLYSVYILALGVVVSLSDCVITAGSGKTTLLNTLYGKYKADSGEVWVGGQPLTGRLRKQMAYVLQEDIMYASLTLQETLYVSKGGRLCISGPSRAW